LSVTRIAGSALVAAGFGTGAFAGATAVTTERTNGSMAEIMDPPLASRIPGPLFQR
jgi:hypothetical protein